jgi:hypothetical protein
MSQDAKIELAWANFLQSNNALNQYLVNQRFQPEKHEHLIEEMNAAMNELLSQCDEESL